MTSAIEWIREHDDRLSFVILYIGGAIALSIWLNLFWVIALMLGHFMLEIVRGHLLAARRPLLHALWEVKLDIALVLFALVVALYAEHVLAVLGLGQAARAGQAATRGVQFATRFAIIERGLRVAVLTMDDVARMIQAAIKFRNRKAAPEPQPAMAATPPEDERLTAGDLATLAFGAVCLLLIVLMPTLVGTAPDEVGRLILEEVSPYK